MVYKVGICDDDENARNYAKETVNTWSKENHINIIIRQFTSAEEFLFQYVDEYDYDILLLDIEMKEMNGVDLAKRIRMENKEVQIIFISGFIEYITDGYDVEALHFLLKPLNRNKLIEILEKAKNRITKNEKVMLLPTMDGIQRVYLKEMRYIEVRLNYLTIYGDKEYIIKKTLSNMEKELDESFIRSHRSYMININYIRTITKTEVLLEDGTTIPLSKAYYDKVNQAFIRYY